MDGQEGAAFSALLAETATCSTRADEFLRRIYAVGAPILLTLGLCGNFAVIAILSKQRFRLFPAVTLIQSHAIANIFYLFVGLFLGNYMRALSNFSFLQQFGQWGCRFYLSFGYALSYATSWHFAASSCLRSLMAISPSFYTDRRCGLIVRITITAIIAASFLLSSLVLWPIASTTPNSNNSNNATLPASIETNSSHAKQSKTCKQYPCAVRDVMDDESFFGAWKVVDLTAAFIFPLSVVLANSILLPFVQHYRPIKRAANKATTLKQASISVVSRSSLVSSSSRSSCRQQRSRWPVELVASNLASMLRLQDLIFIAFSFLILTAFLVVQFPKPLAGRLLSNGNNEALMDFVNSLFYLSPFVNLFQYSLCVLQFPVFACCSNNNNQPNQKAAKKKKKSSKSSAGSKVVSNKAVGGRRPGFLIGANGRGSDRNSSSSGTDQNSWHLTTATTTTTATMTPMTTGTGLFCSLATSEEILNSSPLGFVGDDLCSSLPVSSVAVINNDDNYNFFDYYGDEDDNAFEMTTTSVIASNLPPPPPFNSQVNSPTGMMMVADNYDDDNCNDGDEDYPISDEEFGV